MASAQIRSLRCVRQARTEELTQSPHLPYIPSCQEAQQSRLWNAEAGAWEPTK